MEPQHDQERLDRGHQAREEEELTMKIEPEDPRAHFDNRAYSRAIVPGTLPDQRKQYGKIMFRPDSLRFSLVREHKNATTGPWRVSSVVLEGWRVLKGDRLSGADGQYYSDSYDMIDGKYRHVAPADVIEYINMIVDSLNTHNQEG